MYARYIRHTSRSPVSIALTWFAGTLLVGGALFAIVRQAQASGPSALLPNLVATPPDNASIETSYDEGGLRHENSPGELLLRFNGYVHNDGEGALDLQGERSAPVLHSATSEREVENRESELKRAGEEEEEGKEPKEPQELSQVAEGELAIPSMNVSQRLFETNSGIPISKEEKKHNEENENYLKRAHKDELSKAEMLYVNADGHHHWHLQHIAKYSLWNATKTAEVAPSEKVGFCLEDSERVEVEKENKSGKREPTPEAPVYSDEVAPYRHFCQRYTPYATGVYEGISPGWRDEYGSFLAFQWVDISDVLPGEYWLREEVNPEGKIIEEGRGEKAAFATEPTIVPGFDALPQEASPHANEPVAVTLTSKAWGDENPPSYRIVSSPTHGGLEQINGDQFIYRPSAGYAGSDSFTFSASDPNSEFPRNPAVATVSINVGATPVSPPAPTVAISGAPAEMIAGTSVQLSAATNDHSEVTWSASAGSIASGGLYTAPSEPPAGGAVLITARSAKGAEADATIKILPVPPSQAAPAATLMSAASPQTTSTPPTKSLSSPPIVYRPEAMLIGRKLIMTIKVRKAGRVRLSAYIGHRLLGSCAAKTPGNRTFTCRITLGRRISLDARIAIAASLKIGHKTLSSARPAARVSRMKMPGPSRLSTTHGFAGKASSGPSMGM